MPDTGPEWWGAQLNGCQFMHGMVHNVLYTGVHPKNLLVEAGVSPLVSWILPEGADRSPHDAQHPDGKGDGWMPDRVQDERRRV